MTGEVENYLLGETISLHSDLLTWEYVWRGVGLVRRVVLLGMRLI